MAVSAIETETNFHTAVHRYGSTYHKYYIHETLHMYVRDSTSSTIIYTCLYTVQVGISTWPIRIYSI